MFLKRSRWCLRKEQLSPCRSVTSCTSQRPSPSPPRCVSVALYLPHTSLIADHHPRFPSISGSSLPVSVVLFLRNQRSLLLNSGLRQLTFMRLDIPVQPHSYVQWAKGQKPPHTPRSPSPTRRGLAGSWGDSHQFHFRRLCRPQMTAHIARNKQVHAEIKSDSVWSLIFHFPLKRIKKAWKKKLSLCVREVFETRRTTWCLAFGLALALASVNDWCTNDGWRWVRCLDRFYHSSKATSWVVASR